MSLKLNSSPKDEQRMAHWYDDPQERDRLTLRQRQTACEQMLSSHERSREIATALLEEHDAVKRMETLLPGIPSADLLEELKRRGFEISRP